MNSDLSEAPKRKKDKHKEIKKIFKKSIIIQTQNNTKDSNCQIKAKLPKIN